MGKATEAVARATSAAFIAVVKKYKLPEKEAYQFFTEEMIRYMRSEEEAIDINK